MDLTETQCKDVDWIHLAQGVSIAGCCEHRNVYSNYIKGGKFSVFGRYRAWILTELQTILRFVMIFLSLSTRSPRKCCRVSYDRLLLNA